MEAQVIPIRSRVERERAAALADLEAAQALELRAQELFVVAQARRRAAEIRVARFESEAKNED
jgi:hypothetical protein